MNTTNKRVIKENDLVRYNGNYWRLESAIDNVSSIFDDDLMLDPKEFKIYKYQREHAKSINEKDQTIELYNNEKLYHFKLEDIFIMTYVSEEKDIDLFNDMVENTKSLIAEIKNTQSLGEDVGEFIKNIEDNIQMISEAPILDKYNK